MAQTSTQEIDRARNERKALLDALYDLHASSGRNVHQSLWLQQAGQIAGITEYREILAAASYLDQKGLISLSGGGASVKITVAGVDMVERWRAPLPDKTHEAEKHSNVIFNAPFVGGFQFQSRNSTQSVSVSITKVEENIQKLGELLGRCGIADLDKEEAVLALERLRSLDLKPKTPDVVAKAKEKLELVKSTLETAKEIYSFAAPCLQILFAHFAIPPTV
jgi:hypothetical protein